MGGDKKKKLRRIKGQPLAQIRGAMKETQKKADERDEARRAYIKDSPYFKDQVHWGLQVIYDADVTKVADKDRVIIARLPDDLIEREDSFAKAIRDLDIKTADVIERWALRAGCNPRSIDPTTGVIKDEDAEFEYEDFDPSKLADPTEDIDATDDEEGSDL
jgi:hypothetical protein